MQILRFDIYLNRYPIIVKAVLDGTYIIKIVNTFQIDVCHWNFLRSIVFFLLWQYDWPSGIVRTLLEFLNLKKNTSFPVIRKVFCPQTFERSKIDTKRQNEYEMWPTTCGLTFPVSVWIAVAVRRTVDVTVPETSQPKIGDFQHESAVDHAIAGLETSMRAEFAAVQITHSLKNKNIWNCGVEKS